MTAQDDLLYRRSENQRATYRVVASMGAYGATWADVGQKTDLHHGVVSGALSVLHKRGIVCRLKQTRGRCKVYVLPEHVNGRETEAQGVKHAPVVCWNCGEVQ